MKTNTPSRITDDWTEGQKDRWRDAWRRLIDSRDGSIPLDLDYDTREVAYELGALDRPCMRVSLTLHGKRYRAVLFEQQDEMADALCIEFERRRYQGTLFAEGDGGQEQGRIR